MSFQQRSVKLECKQVAADSREEIRCQFHISQVTGAESVHWLIVENLSV
jgi:hypothetical protein